MPFAERASRRERNCERARRGRGVLLHWLTIRVMVACTSYSPRFSILRIGDSIHTLHMYIRAFIYSLALYINEKLTASEGVQELKSRKAEREKESNELPLACPDPLLDPTLAGRGTRRARLSTRACARGPRCRYAMVPKSTGVEYFTPHTQ